jgi:hypothetical protein
VRLFSLVLLAAALLVGQDHDGGFIIRFEPTAILQPGAPIPFKITVQDPRYKPLPDAKVTLQIETEDHQKVQVYKAVQTDPGTYVAQPVFSDTGVWIVYVHVQRNAEFGERTIRFTVSQPPS